MDGVLQLSEISQIEKDKCGVISLTCGIERANRTERESRTQRTNRRSPGERGMGGVEKWVRGVEV